MKRRRVVTTVLLLLAAWNASAETIRVATYNVENYLEMDRRVDGRFRRAYPKPEREKAAVRKVIHQTAPDVIALQEFGPEPYLEEFHQDLAREGSVYEHRILLEAADPERHLAVLSKIPFAEVIEHAEVPFTYFGEHELVKRGMLEVSFEAPDGRWTLFVVHLKSRYTDRPDDPLSEERRVLEARKLRDIIRKRFPDPGKARFVIAGDFNDTRGSRAVRAFLQYGRRTLSKMIPAVDSRGESWTHNYRREEVLSRVDYLLISPGMWPHLSGERGVVFDGAGASEGSDHRLVYADLQFARGNEKASVPQRESEALEN